MDDGADCRPGLREVARWSVVGCYELSDYRQSPDGLLSRLRKMFCLGRGKPSKQNPGLNQIECVVALIRNLRRKMYSVPGGGRKGALCEGEGKIQQNERKRRDNGQ